MVIKNENIAVKKTRQSKERQERAQARESLQNEQECKLKRKRQKSWLKPWLYVCQHIRAYPEADRTLIFQTYIPLRKLPRTLVGNFINNPAYLLNLITASGRKTEELGTPLDTFPIAKTVDSIKINSIEWHKLLTNKGQFNVFQNPSFSPPIQLINLFEDNNSKLRRLESLKKIIGEESGNFNKRLSGTLSSLMATGGPAILIVVQMGDVSNRTTSVALLPTFWDFLGADPDQHLSQFLTALSAFLNRAKVWEECHYDQFLTARATMIPVQGSYQNLTWNGSMDAYPRMLDTKANSSANIQGPINITPLQAIPPNVTTTYAPYFPYQQQTLTIAE
uniref:Predicted protein n=1 Tax=Physcomitrium patens TaxID=3218 RepID=A9TME4_PHYPA